MRRPRSKLQVSTFPFLAVLLCAMGALLLLLFIMDRRAKIAAQHQVAELHHKRQERSKAEEDARNVEWEKARAALHQTLLEQQGQLITQSKKVQAGLNDAGKKIQLIQARDIELQGKIENENKSIVGLHNAIASQKSGLSEADRKENASKADLIAAANELADLERAFQQLRALKDRDKHTYSVVPYRGKRGDERPPIYVECTQAGVLFHPDRKVLHLFELSPSSIRAEVERRHGPLAVQKKNADERGPYVLFLIRPDGIANYYKAQSALKGYQLDFGYELVDAHWELDFRGDAKGGPAGKLAKDSPAVMPLPAPPILPNPALPMAPPSGKPGGVAFGSSLPAPPVVPPLGVPGVGNIGSGGPIAGGPGLSSQPSPLGFPNVGSVGSGGPGVSDQQPRTAVVNVPPEKGPSFVPVNKIPPAAPIAPSAPTSVPGINTSPLPRTDSVANSAPKAPSGSNEPTTSRPLPPFGVEPEKKTPPPPIRPLVNKDFVITIECLNDAVTVNPGGMSFRWTATNLQATNEALVQSVSSLIARRQASVRSGEPPYRPLIRFNVSPEGLRTYYHVYPLLETLRVPMTRENLRE